ncbi:Reverse transcriptase (RNA-dependent DNA polymerase) [Popillia japonica]|uniref:Reverse transcriptase (RNA-dependent DNA polymerase) n=1 Tax=Popillia japonica TaxID=7064 RepID=A0AAW1HUN1_POPJA
MALSVQLNFKITHLDVKTAFLNGVLKENVFMAQPEGFIVPGYESKVCKLKKAVYGLKQSSRTWNNKVDDVLLNLGFKRKNILKYCICQQHNSQLTC